MNKSALIIINPTAGQEEACNYEELIKAKLQESYSEIHIKYTEREGDATSFAKEAAEQRVNLVVALGGDGTVNETVNGLAPFDDPPVLGIIPMGTVNDLARSLNIPLQPEDAIELLVNGVEKKVDVGLAENRYFTNFLIIGNASKAIHEVDSNEKSKLGSFAYFIEVAKKIAKDETFRAKVEMPEDSWQGEAAIVIIGLIDSLGGIDSILTDTKLGDGMFHILVIKEFNLSKLLNMTPDMLKGKIKNSNNVESFTSSQVKVTALNQSIEHSDIDGEKGPKLPIEVKIFPRHLTIRTGLEE